MTDRYPIEKAEKKYSLYTDRKCPLCGSVIPGDSITCPYCGRWQKKLRFKLSRRTRRRIKRFIMRYKWLFVAAAAVLILLIGGITIHIGVKNGSGRSSANTYVQRFEEEKKKLEGSTTRNQTKSSGSIITASIPFDNLRFSDFLYEEGSGTTATISGTVWNGNSYTISGMCYVIFNKNGRTVHRELIMVPEIAAYETGVWSDLIYKLDYDSVEYANSVIVES